jgi:hypothetical protein
VQWGAPAESAGSVIEFVVLGSQSKKPHVLPLEIKATGGWDHLQSASIGPLDLPAGQVVITARAKKVNGIAPCNLGTLKLTPAKD